MFNKGLELIEAARLFDLPESQVDVLIHPQSVVHGMVCYSDGSVLAQLGSPDMRIPIAHTLAWPERLSTNSPRLNLAKVAKLEFEEPDIAVRFPALRLARDALRAGGGAPTILNAANEVAVSRLPGPPHRLPRHRRDCRGRARPDGRTTRPGRWRRSWHWTRRAAGLRQSTS